MEASNPVGRPPIITPDILAKLEIAFANGASDLQACFIAGIGKSTLYNYQNDNPHFVERKEALKDMLKYQAKTIIAESIKDNNLDTAKWYAERKIKDEFSIKQETEFTGTLPVTINVEKHSTQPEQGNL